MSIHGKNFIGNDLSSNGDKTSKLYDINSNEALDGEFFHATQNEVEVALAKADKAFIEYKQTSQAKRAEFLETIASEIMNLGDELIIRTMSESNLRKQKIISC